MTINGVESIALLISLFFPPERGGGASGAWNRALVLNNLGYSVFVLSNFPTYPTGRVIQEKYRRKLFFVEKMESFTVIRIRLLPLEHSGYLKRLIIFLNFLFLSVVYLPAIMRIVKRKSIDIVYARSPVIFSSIIGMIYSKITGSFFIYEAPDLWPDEFVVYNTKLFPIIYPVGKFLARLSFSVPDIVITVSHYAAKYIRENYRPSHAVYGIPVGVDSTKFCKYPMERSRAEMIDRKVFPDKLRDKFIILHSGIISSIYRVEDLIRAAEQLKKDEKIAFLIIGEGDEKKKLQNLKLQLKLDNVHILPSQDRDAMPTIISAVNVCTILLSAEPIYDIVLPIRFYEYLACKKPLVAYSKGELADLIDTYGIGFTIESGDIVSLVRTIISLKSSGSMVHKVEGNTSRALKDFSLEGIGARFESVLRTEMANHGPKRR